MPTRKRKPKHAKTAPHRDQVAPGLQKPKHDDISKSSDSRIQIRVLGAVVDITCHCGDIILSGENAGAVPLLTWYIHQNLLRGWTPSDVLRVALKIADEFGGEVLNLEGVKASIRNAWLRVLKASLLADPSQSHRERMSEFHTWAGLGVTLKAGSHCVLRCGRSSGASFDLSDPEFVIVQSGDKRPWRARWERLTQVSFSYFEPPSEWLSGCLAMQARRPSSRKMAALGAAEVQKQRQKLPAHWQELMKSFQREQESIGATKKIPARGRPRPRPQR